MRAKFAVLELVEYTNGLHLRPNFVSIIFFCLPLAANNVKFCRFLDFGVLYFVVSPTGSVRRKLNAGAQLQTFPYPTLSKSFL